jgi:hypothetical protein
VWYNKVVKAVALDIDFAIMQDGDQRGCTGLSGGQKQASSFLSDQDRSNHDLNIRELRLREQYMPTLNS